MKRKIIEIDVAKCNGCGVCIPNCPEGALQLIDGKARLVGDLFCDGLGACLGECPRGAIRTIEREAEPYDERRVMANIVRQGAGTIRAHLKHLKSHGEFKYLETAVACLKEHGLPIPELEDPDKQSGGLPRNPREEAGGKTGNSTRWRSFRAAAVAGPAETAESGGGIFRPCRPADFGGLRRPRLWRVPPGFPGRKNSGHPLSEAGQRHRGLRGKTGGNFPAP